jgi:hypothetical protein
MSEGCFFCGDDVIIDCFICQRNICEACGEFYDIPGIITDYRRICKECIKLLPQIKEEEEKIKDEFINARFERIRKWREISLSKGGERKRCRICHNIYEERSLKKAKAKDLDDDEIFFCKECQKIILESVLEK